MKEKKVTLIYCPYGVEQPYWAALGWARIGRKNIRFRFKEDEDLFGNTDHVLKKSDCVVLEGWNPTVIKQVEDYRQKLKEWREARERFNRELERELTDLRLKRIDEWYRQNPAPVFNLGGENS